MSRISIEGEAIGIEHGSYIMAETPRTHSGDLEEVFNIIPQARRYGGDAVKLQAYAPSLILLSFCLPNFPLKHMPVLFGERFAHAISMSAFDPIACFGMAVKWHEGP